MASERGGAQTNLKFSSGWGCKKIAELRARQKFLGYLNDLERSAREGESPVREIQEILLAIFLSTVRRKPCRKQAELPAKAKYYLHTDSELSTVRER